MAGSASEEKKWTGKRRSTSPAPAGTRCEAPAGRFIRRTTAHPSSPHRGEGIARREYRELLSGPQHGFCRSQPHRGGRLVMLQPAVRMPLVDDAQPTVI